MVNHKCKRNWDDPRDKKFRREVRRRDDHKCQWPNCNSRFRLQVHHIIKWASNILLRYNPKNGITLCRVHHDKIKNKEQSYVKLFLSIVQRKYE